jgi:hypothetical protein
MPTAERPASAPTMQAKNLLRNFDKVMLPAKQGPESIRKDYAACLTHSAFDLSRCTASRQKSQG